MPFLIRNKGILGNPNKRAFIPKRRKLAKDLGRFVTLQTQPTRFTGMRIYHNYRNISRAAKQFLLGNKHLEEQVILTIREQFYRPMHYKAPIENIVYLGRTMADMLDRHYALVAHNQHPLQLFIYKTYNQFLREENDPQTQEDQSNIKKRIMELTEQKMEELNLKEGETMAIEDIDVIYEKAMEEFRSKENFQYQTRTKTGEINDYLEVRRPFGSAE